MGTSNSKSDDTSEAEAATLDACVLKSVNAFNDLIYSRLVGYQAKEPINTIISPLSLYTSLLILYTGCQGATRSQLAKALQLASGKDQIYLDHLSWYAHSQVMRRNELPSMKIWNRLFMDDSVNLKVPFEKSLVNLFACKCEKINFSIDANQAFAYMDDWLASTLCNKAVSEFTLVENSSTNQLAFANGVRFQGYWKVPFDGRRTYGDLFDMPNGFQRKVNMMTTFGSFAVGNLSGLDANMIRLPLTDRFVNPQDMPEEDMDEETDDWSMIIILPNSCNGLQKLISQLSKSGQLLKVIGRKFKHQRTSLFMPRFHSSTPSGLDMNDLLNSLGVNSLLGTKQANLTGISKDPGVKMNGLFHKTGIEVNEVGITQTKTEFHMTQFTMAEKSCSFRIGHPFFYAIVYTNRIPIIIGHVTDPEII